MIAQAEVWLVKNVRPITPGVAETETWVTVAAKNRACCPGLRIDKAVMKMLCPRDLPTHAKTRRETQGLR